MSDNKRNFNDGPLTFNEWKRKVNAIVSSKLGLGIYDLADWPMWDAWDDEVEPVDAIEIMADYQDFPDMFYELLNG